MRIATGKFRNRGLKIPRLENVRPTREMVRKAIFDVLSGVVEGRDVLDLFSGSGALGFEALSAGAKSVTFVERQKPCVRIIRENAASIDAYASSNSR